MSEVLRNRRNSERAAARSGALLEIKSKLKHLDEDIAFSREKMGIISKTAARDSHETETSNRKTSEYTEESYYSTNGETDLLVTGKMNELRAAQQRADNALQELERLRVEVLQLADHQINSAIKEFEKTKQRLKEEYENQLKFAEMELHRKIKDIKERSQQQIESKLSFYQSNRNFTFADESRHGLKEKTLPPYVQSNITKKHFEGTSLSKNKENQYSHATERRESQGKLVPNDKKPFADVASEIEARLQFVKDSITDFKSKILSEKTAAGLSFENKESSRISMRKTANSSARKVRKLSMQILHDISSSEDEEEEDLAKYLALKRKLQEKKKIYKENVSDRKSIR